MKILVVAQHDNTTLAISTLHVLTAAQCFGGEVTVLVAGYQCASVAEQVSVLTGVHAVFLADARCYQHFLAENLTPLVVECAQDKDAVLAPATTFGKNVLPRVAAKLDVEQFSDVSAILDGETFQRPIYAGNAIVTERSEDRIKVMTVRPSAFAKLSTTQQPAEIVSLRSQFDLQIARYVKAELTQSEHPELTDANCVVAGGRALASKENFALIEKLASTLNAAVGASRAAVDAGFVANDCQVGQTGKVVAPKLYIAVGISGAIQHLAGMKDAKCVVAINKDEEAPIFQVADYGLVGDLFVILPQLTAAFEEMLQKQ